MAFVRRRCGVKRVGHAGTLDPAASGVLRYFEERGIGLMFGTVAVPIVAGAVLFDLLAGDPMARPGPEAGYAACAAAATGPGLGAVGAGTGASVAKAGGSRRQPPRRPSRAPSRAPRRSG